MIDTEIHTPAHSVEWLEDYFKKNYYKRPYNRFHWWRSYVSKNKPLSTKEPLCDRILNGDFDFGPFMYEAELVEHKLNKKYKELRLDPGKYVEETSLDRARRKRLLEDFEVDEKRKLEGLAKSFSKITGLKEEEVLDELAEYNDTLIEFYYYLTEKCLKKK